jgi:hypothetical protein
MEILRIIGWSLAGGAAGFLLGAAGASVAAAALHMSKMEGGPGFFAIGVGLLTGLLGALVAMMVTLHSRGVVSASLFRGSLLVAGGIVLLGAGAHRFYQQSQDRFTKKYGSVALHCEVRPRASEAGTDWPGFRAELQEDDDISPLEWAIDRSGRQEETAVFPASGRIYRLTSHRRIVLRFADGQSLVFSLAIPRDPTDPRSREWSGWSGAASGSGPEWVIRYRVIM